MPWIPLKSSSVDAWESPEPSYTVCGCLGIPSNASLGMCENCQTLLLVCLGIPLKLPYMQGPV